MIVEKHLMLLIMSYLIGWRQREAFLRHQPKGNFSPKIKTTYPWSQNTLSCSSFQTIKASRSGGNSWNQRKAINGNSKLAHCEETVGEIEQESRLPREVFQPSNFADDGFQQEKAFSRRSIDFSTNPWQMVLRKDIDVFGKKDKLNNKNHLRFESFVSFETCALFLKIPKSSNCPFKDFLARNFTIQLKNNLKK